MEKIRCGQVSAAMKKGKKKQAKGELDRLKQAEKKKRRLEKALATSAALRSELEQKKQKKIEEQKRLDEEGASIAEAVALHVLGGEDADESCHFMINNTSKHNHWEYSSNFDISMDYQSFTNYSIDGWELGTNTYNPSWKWNSWGIGLPLPPQFFTEDVQSPHFHKASQGADISAEILAAQAVSSLQIAEDPHGGQFVGRGAATITNKMLGGSSTSDKVNIYRKI
ncbi:unnamed protein product [Musa textilis]